MYIETHPTPPSRQSNINKKLLAPSGALVFFMGYYKGPLFSNSSDSKVLKRPNVCYIFEKHGIQGYQI